MGITERKWTVHEAGDPEKVGRLATELGVDRVLAELLVQRGVETFEQARRFFRPSLDDLHDPFLMKDMDKAVERLHEAITRGEKILVYGDYDVDGTTAVALVYSFVRRFTKRVEYYIPDRYDEGYGVSYKGLDWASDNGINLITCYG
jgi:single-stranded-DNA-specific exonuclease